MVSGFITRWRLAQHARKPRRKKTIGVLERSGFCWACGQEHTWKHAPVISNELAEAWAIDDTIREAFDARESMFCPNCGCSCRLRMLAEALATSYGASSLQELATKPSFRALAVAEINSCGALHRWLSQIPDLRYSEYGSSDPKVPSEDLTKLSYQPETFDLVLHSDTLEHVPDFSLALKEVYRILKPGGRHIFTIPVVWERQTKQRAKIDQGKITHLAPPSYHGAGEPDNLVFSEFGADVLSALEAVGFIVHLFGMNLSNLKDPSGVFITEKGKQQ